MAEIRNDLVSYQTRLSDLQTRYQKATQDVATDNKDISADEGKFKQEEAQIQKLTQELQSSKKELESFKPQELTLNNELQTAQKDVQAYQKDFQANQLELNKTNEAVSKFQADISNIQKEVSNLDKFVREGQQKEQLLSQQLTREEGAVKTLDNEIKQDEADVKILNQDVTKGSQDVKKKQGDVDRQKSVTETDKKAIQTARNDKTAVQKEVNKNEGLVRESSSVVSEKKGRVDDNTTKERNTLENKNHAKQAFDTATNEFKTANTDFNTKKTDYGNKRTTADTAQQDYSKASSDAQGAEGTARSAMQRAGSLKPHEGNYYYSAQEKDSKGEVRTVRKFKSGEYNAAMGRYKAAKRDAESLTQQAKGKRAESNRKKGTAKQRKQEADTAKKNMDKAQKTLQEKKKTREAKNKDHQETIKKHDEAKKNLQTSKSELEKSNKKLTDNKKLLSLSKTKLNQKDTALKNRINKLSGEAKTLENMKSALSENKNKLKVTQQKLEGNRKKVAKKRTSCSEKKKALNVTRENRTRNNTQLTAKKGEVATKKQALTAVQNKQKAAKENSVKAKGRMDTAQAKYKGIEGKIKEIGLKKQSIQQKIKSAETKVRDTEQKTHQFRDHGIRDQRLKDRKAKLGKDQETANRLKAELDKTNRDYEEAKKVQQVKDTARAREAKIKELEARNPEAAAALKGEHEKRSAEDNKFIQQVEAKKKLEAATRSGNQDEIVKAKAEVLRTHGRGDDAKKLEDENKRYHSTEGVSERKRDENKEKRIKQLQKEIAEGKGLTPAQIAMRKSELLQLNGREEASAEWDEKSKELKTAKSGHFVDPSTVKPAQVDFSKIDPNERLSIIDKDRQQKGVEGALKEAETRYGVKRNDLQAKFASGQPLSKYEEEALAVMNRMNAEIKLAPDRFDKYKDDKRTTAISTVASAQDTDASVNITMRQEMQKKLGDERAINAQKRQESSEKKVEDSRDTAKHLGNYMASGEYYEDSATFAKKEGEGFSDAIYDAGKGVVDLGKGTYRVVTNTNLKDDVEEQMGETAKQRMSMLNDVRGTGSLTKENISVLNERYNVNYSQETWEKLQNSKGFEGVTDPYADPKKRLSDGFENFAAKAGDIPGELAAQTKKQLEEDPAKAVGGILGNVLMCYTPVKGVGALKAVNAAEKAEQVVQKGVTVAKLAEKAREYVQPTLTKLGNMATNAIRTTETGQKALRTAEDVSATLSKTAGKLEGLQAAVGNKMKVLKTAVEESAPGKFASGVEKRIDGFEKRLTSGWAQFEKENKNVAHTMKMLWDNTAGPLVDIPRGLGKGVSEGLSAFTPAKGLKGMSEGLSDLAGSIRKKGEPDLHYNVTSLENNPNFRRLKEQQRMMADAEQGVPDSLTYREDVYIQGADGTRVSTEGGYSGDIPDSESRVIGDYQQFADGGQYTGMRRTGIADFQGRTEISPMRLSVDNVDGQFVPSSKTPDVKTLEKEGRLGEVKDAFPATSKAMEKARSGELPAEAVKSVKAAEMKSLDSAQELEGLQSQLGNARKELADLNKREQQTRDALKALEKLDPTGHKENVKMHQAVLSEIDSAQAKANRLQLEINKAEQASKAANSALFDVQKQHELFDPQFMPQTPEGMRKYEIMSKNLVGNLSPEEKMRVFKEMEDLPLSYFEQINGKHSISAVRNHDEWADKGLFKYGEKHPFETRELSPKDIGGVYDSTNKKIIMNLSSKPGSGKHECYHALEELVQNKDMPKPIKDGLTKLQEMYANKGDDYQSAVDKLGRYSETDFHEFFAELGQYRDKLPKDHPARVNIDTILENLPKEKKPLSKSAEKGFADFAGNSLGGDASKIQEFKETNHNALSLIDESITPSSKKAEQIKNLLNNITKSVDRDGTLRLLDNLGSNPRVDRASLRELMPAMTGNVDECRAAVHQFKKAEELIPQLKDGQTLFVEGKDLGLDLHIKDADGNIVRDREIKLVTSGDQLPRNVRKGLEQSNRPLGNVEREVDITYTGKWNEGDRDYNINDKTKKIGDRDRIFHSMWTDLKDPGTELDRLTVKSLDGETYLDLMKSDPTSPVYKKWGNMTQDEKRAYTLTTETTKAKYSHGVNPERPTEYNPTRPIAGSKEEAEMLKIYNSRISQTTGKQLAKITDENWEEINTSLRMSFRGDLKNNMFRYGEGEKLLRSTTTATADDIARAAGVDSTNAVKGTLAREYADLRDTAMAGVDPSSKHAMVFDDAMRANLAEETNIANGQHVTSAVSTMSATCDKLGITGQEKLKMMVAAAFHDPPNKIGAGASFLEHNQAAAQRLDKVFDAYRVDGKLPAEMEDIYRTSRKIALAHQESPSGWMAYQTACESVFKNVDNLSPDQAKAVSGMLFSVKSSGKLPPDFFTKLRGMGVPEEKVALLETNLPGIVDKIYSPSKAPHIAPSSEYEPYKIQFTKDEQGILNNIHKSTGNPGEDFVWYVQNPKDVDAKEVATMIYSDGKPNYTETSGLRKMLPFSDDIRQGYKGIQGLEGSSFSDWLKHLDDSIPGVSKLKEEAFATRLKTQEAFEKALPAVEAKYKLGYAPAMPSPATLEEQQILKVYNDYAKEKGLPEFNAIDADNWPKVKSTYKDAFLDDLMPEMKKYL